MGEALSDLRPGQQRIMRTFQNEGFEVYVPADIMDLRVCMALEARGLLRFWESADGRDRGFELTESGRTLALSKGDRP